MDEMRQHRGFLGRDADGARTWITIALHLIEPAFYSRRPRSTAHDPLDAYLAFDMSASGGHRGPRTNRELRRITRPATGWSTEDVGRLAALWSKYQGNNVRYACDHQDENGQPYVCPEGYEYGGYRMVQVITPEDTAEIRTLAAKLNGAWR